MKLRRPPWLFAAFGVLLLFGIGFVVCVWAASGLRGFDPAVAEGLLWPTAIGAGLAAGMIGGRLRRGLILKHSDAVARATMAGAAAGFVWPLSFGIAALFQGDATPLFSSFPIAVVGALIGALAGAIGAAAASLVCLH